MSCTCKYCSLFTRHKPAMVAAVDIIEASGTTPSEQAALWTYLAGFLIGEKATDLEKGMRVTTEAFNAGYTQGFNLRTPKLSN